MKSLFQQYLGSLSRDGGNASILESAAGVEREQLENDLIAYLAVDAALAADALRIMESVEAAPQLREAMDEADAESRAHLARALWAIDGDARWVEPIAKAVTDQAISSVTRTRLISLLYQVKHPDAFIALESAMLDHDHLIRWNAAFIYSENSARKTADSTISNNVGQYDEIRIRRFIKRMRGKVDA